MCSSLSTEVVDRLAPFVDRDDLERMRVVTGPPGNWIPLLLGTGAVTLGNQVFFRSGRFDPVTPRGLALIGHEAEHVAQYRRLGTAGFLWRYVRGSVTSRFSHARHPMERDVVELQRRIRTALEED